MVWRIGLAVLITFTAMMFNHQSRNYINTTHAQRASDSDTRIIRRKRKLSRYTQKNKALSKNISRVNRGAVGIITGDIGGTYIRIASDLAAVLDSTRKPELRILPISGRGGVSNIEDLLFLRDIDLAIVQSDILTHMEQNLGYRDIRKKIHYVTKLFDSEVHIITRKSIRDIRQLQNRKVNFRFRGSSSDITGKAVLKALKISVIPTYFDQSLALEKIKRGELDASIVIAGKPSSIYSQITQDAGLHFLPINYNLALAKRYLPAILTHEDYPGLVSPGKQIPTIASSTILAVYNWPKDSSRYQKVELLVHNLFTYITDLKKPERHRKWTTTSPVTRVAGWNRFRPAQDWIDNSYRFVTDDNASSAVFALSSYNNRGSKEGMTAEQRERLFRSFNAYLINSSRKQRTTPQEMYTLFESFLKWRNANR